METVLNSNYTIGSAAWDTGQCEKCKKILPPEERKQAAINMLVSGMMYWCRQCTDTFFAHNKRIYK